MKDRRRWYIALELQNPFDVRHDGNGGLVARTWVAIWPILFKTGAEALEYGRRHHVARGGWTPDGHLIKSWRVCPAPIPAPTEA